MADFTSRQATLAAAQTKARTKTTVQRHQERIAAAQAPAATFAPREPEYDPFAAGTGYAEPEYAPQEAPPPPPSPLMQTPKHIQDTKSPEAHAQERIDDIARDLGFEDAETMHQTVADLREQGEAYQRELEEAELEKQRELEESAYCRDFIRNLLANVNRALAAEREEAQLLGEFLGRYPELFYDLMGRPSEESIRALISETIQLYGREKVKFRDSDIERLYSAAARWDRATLQADIQRQAIARLEAGDGSLEADCWRRYQAHLASQTKKGGGGKKVAFAVLGAYLLGVF